MQTEWFIIVRSLDRWWIDREGKSFGPFESELEARQSADRICEAFRDERRTTHIFGPGDDGRYHWHGSAGAPPDPARQ